MNNEKLLENMNKNFDFLYKKYLLSNEFIYKNILDNDHPLFIVFENHKYIIQKTQNNLNHLKEIIDQLNKYYFEINSDCDKNIFLTIYLECQSILDNINELDIGIDKHHKIFENLT